MSGLGAGCRGIRLTSKGILNLIRSVRTENGLKILVLDETTEELVFSVLGKNELLDVVTAIERIDRRRNNQVQVEAVYLLEPTLFSVNCLIADFTNIPARYKAAHIYLLPGLTIEVSNHMNSNYQLKKNIRTVEEFYLNIHPKEANAFTTKNPGALQVYYNPQCHDLVTQSVKRTATCLVDVCVLTGEYPIIRYYQPNDNDSYFNASILPKMIANEFQDQLDEYTRHHPDFPPASTRQRSIFMITDRTLDLFAPLLHEFSYQAMAYDLSSNIHRDVYKYEAETEMGTMEPKESKLDDKDDEWNQLKHLHILDAKELLNSKTEEFLAKNPLFVDRSNIKTTSDILSAIAHLKGFDEDRRKLILHKTLIEELILINGERKLVELSEFEQDVANFGVDIEGERIKNLSDVLITLLSYQSYTTNDKIRVIVIYGLFRGGLIEQDFVKLLNFIGILDEAEVANYLKFFANFELIGFKLIKPNLKSKSVFKRQLFHTSVSENAYNTSRFRPAIEPIISKLLSNTLDDITFPYIKDKPLDMETDITRTNSTSTISLKNPKHKASWAKSNSQYQPPRQRIFYFIAGGATYSELKSVYELSNKFEKDVIIGSDEFITPIQFVYEVKRLSMERPDLKLFLDWLNHRPTTAPKYLLEVYADNARPKQQQHHQHSTSNTYKLETAEQAQQAQQPVHEDKEKKRSKFKKFFKG